MGKVNHFFKGSQCFLFFFFFFIVFSSYFYAFFCFFSFNFLSFFLNFSCFIMLFLHILIQNGRFFTIHFVFFCTFAPENKNT